MPNCWATRRASSTSDTLQHPVSLSPPHSRMVTPTTSCPCSTRSAAATEESTPPLIATITFTTSHRSRLAAQSTHRCHEHVDRAIDVLLGRRVPEAHPQRADRVALVDSHRGEYVRRLHRPARAGRSRRRADARLVEEIQQRLALDIGEADVCRPGDL